MRKAEAERAIQDVKVLVDMTILACTGTFNLYENRSFSLIPTTQTAKLISTVEVFFNKVRQILWSHPT